MLRSMYSGISGLKNFQTKLDVIGNNIANVSTYGFKKGRVTFKDTMNQSISGASAATETRGGKNPMQVGLGGALASIDLIDTQASMQTTGRTLDVGIEGDGYFVVKNGNSLLYTRAGNFYIDDNGTLVTSDGLKVQAYDKNNKLNDVMVNVNSILPATATTKFELSGELTGSTIAGDVFTQQIQVIDAKGVAFDKTVYFKKSATANQWDAFIGVDPSDSTITPPPTANFSITGNPTTKQFTSSIAAGATLPITLETGNVVNVSIDVSKMLLGTTTNTLNINANGYTQGTLESFTIGGMGEINGVYSNGQVSTLGVLALAKFSNPSGLSKVASNTYQQSINSGVANIDKAGVGRGTLSPGALEMSNVDLSEEFTEMIVAQRGFQANTRIITTSDEILQELVNLKR